MTELNPSRNNSYFRQIIEKTGDVVWVMDISTLKLTYCSPSIFNLLGYHPEEILELPLEKILTPQSYQLFIDLLAIQVNEFKEGNHKSEHSINEFEQYCKGGKIINTEISSTIILDGEGEAKEIIGITSNINSKKHYERIVNALNSASEAMQSALTPDQIFRTISAELMKFRISPTVFSLDENDNTLHSVLMNNDPQISKMIEEYYGITLSEINIRVEDFPEYKEAINKRQTIFVDNPIAFIQKIVPNLKDDKSSELINQLKLASIIVAPIIYDKIVKGILVLTSSSLCELDIPAVSLFTYHLASSLHSGELFEKFNKEYIAREIAEYELSDTDIRYQNLINWSPVGIYQSTMDGKLLAVNKSLAKMLGYDDEKDLIDHTTMNDLYVDIQERRKYLKEFIEKGDDFLKNIEFKWRKKDGSTIWILLTAHSIYDENHNHLYYEGFVQDIERQKKIHFALEHSVSQFKATLESTNDGILVVSLDGMVTNYNRRFTEFWKIPNEILESGKDEELLHYVLDLVKDPEEFIDSIRHIYSLPESDSFDMFEMRDGRIIERYSHPQLMDNKPEGRVWSFRDVTERIKSIENLRKRENQYRVLFEGSNDCIFIMTEDTFIDCNETTLRIFECETKEDIIGKHPWDFSLEHQPDGSLSTEKAKYLIENALNGETQLFYWKHITQKGNLIDCDISLNKIILEDGVVLQVIIRDITDRMRTESAIKESQLQYSSVVDNSNDVILIYQDNKIQFSNATVKKLTGYSPEEFNNKNILDFIVPEDRGKIQHYLQMRIEGQETPSVYELKMLDIAGINIPVEFNISSIQYKGVTADLIFIRDVSERKKAENEILDREYWLSQSQKFARIGSYYLDVHSGIWKCTEALDDIFGIPAEYIKTLQTWGDLIYEKDQQTMMDYFINEVIGKKSVFDKEYRIVRQNDGQVRWVHGRGDLTLDESGNINAMLGTISDIHERKIMEEELTLAKEKAEESSRLKTSLLLNISHELRTPMNGILGFAEILSDSLTDAVQKRMAENILFSGNRLQATLDSIVDLSQIQADTKMMRIEKIDVGLELQKMLNNFNDIATHKKIRIETSVEKDLFALADYNLLDNVLHHLIDNAFKFTDNGCVKVSAHKDPEGEWAVLLVKDTGIGIANDNLDMIFEEFRQVSEGMGRSYEGTGIGLTLCQKFVSMMKGVVNVESEIGVGSLFSVKLPLFKGDNNHPDVAAIADADERVEPPNEEPKIEKNLPQVLLVEDQEYNLELIEIYLKNICETDRALDGISAVKMAFNQRYDAVLMDINLGPGIDGLEATRRIKSIKGYEDIPVIAVTGYSTASEKELILANGCTHYLSKPYNRGSLVSVVKEAIGII